MRLLLASSSTGGHIYPALAIAEEVTARDPGAEILFVSARWEIGKDIVGSYGYRQTFIDVLGFDRGRPWNNFRTLASLIRASRQIRDIFRDFKPDAVVGTGGHVAGPIVRAARKHGVRTMIQEQNVLPGLANRLAERYADRVFIAFPAAAEHFRHKDKLVVSGNPVRAEFFEADKKAAREALGISPDRTVVFVFGGSQGAARINEAAVRVIAKSAGKGYTIILVTGPRLYDEVMAAVPVIAAAEPQSISDSRVMGYAEHIAQYYAAADLIVSRAGALTVSEIAAAGRASVLIPSPNVVNNHQYYNAKALEDLGAALIMNESDIADDGLFDMIDRLACEHGKLAAMGEAAKRLSRGDAVKVIADELFGRKQA